MVAATRLGVDLPELEEDASETLPLSMELGTERLSSLTSALIWMTAVLGLDEREERESFFLKKELFFVTGLVWKKREQYSVCYVL